MSFLDDETTAGQISLGTRRLGLDPLLPRRRRQAARQQQAPGYDILPSTMQPTPGVVSTPTDIAQVGVGQQLQQQGTTAAQVPNVFERYAETGAAPIGDFKRYLYPTSPTQEDEEQNDVIEAANEEFAQKFGYDPYDPATMSGKFYSDQQKQMEAGAAQESAMLGGGMMPFSQSAKAIYAAAQHDITGGKSGRPYVDSVFNYSITGDVSTPPTAAQINVAEFGPQGGGYGTAGAPGYTPPAPATNFDPTGGIDFSDPGFSGSDVSPGGVSGTPATNFDPTGGIDFSELASGGIVIKSNDKNSFMSMKGK